MEDDKFYYCDSMGGLISPLLGPSMKISNNHVRIHILVIILLGVIVLLCVTYLFIHKNSTIRESQVEATNIETDSTTSGDNEINTENNNPSAIKETGQNTNTPSPIPTPPTPPIAPMKTYTNSQYGFTLNYPDGDAYDEQQLTYGGGVGWPLSCKPTRTYIVFGKANLDGGIADGGSGGWINVFPDGGSSCARTFLRSESSESNTIQIGSNKFYSTPKGYFLEKPSYFILGYITHPPNQIDLASLTFY